MKASICAADSAGKVPGIGKSMSSQGRVWRPDQAVDRLDECLRAPLGAEEHCELVELDHHGGAIIAG